MSTLAANGLTVALDGSDILRDVSIEARQGEMIGIIGPNGAGKTTLLRALAGVIPARSGGVTLDGQSARGIDAREHARRIAYLGQDDAVQWAVTAETLVSLGRLPHRPSWRGPNAADRAAVQRALGACDVLQFADRPVNRLSGGERTRVLLARALAVEADFLLADEPVAGLDPAHALQVMEVLARRVEAGLGMIITLHDLSIAARYCRRLVLLHEGVIATEGTPEEVLTAENLSDYYGISAHTGSVGGKPFIVPLTRTDEGPRP